MSSIKTKQKSRLDNQVKLVTVPLVQLKAQGAGEFAYALTGGTNKSAVRAAQSGALDQDYDAIKVVHRNANGRVVAESVMSLGRSDANATVSVVDRAGQSAIRALSDRAEKLVAHQARMAAQKGWTADVRFIVAADRDIDEVQRKHGLVDAEPVDTSHLESYATVQAGRDPGTTFDMKRARKRRGGGS